MNGPIIPNPRVKWIARGVVAVLALLAALLFAIPFVKAAPMPFGYLVACNNAESVVAVIEASHTRRSGVVFQAEVMTGRCKRFHDLRPIGLRFVKVIRDDLKWGDGEKMLVVEAQDKHGFHVFIWMTHAKAKTLGIDGPASQPI